MTTFNPSDKSANVVLSNGDLTAAVNSSASGGVRGTTSHGSSGGKYYVEYLWDLSGSVNLLACGFAAGAADLEDAVPGDTNSPIVRENGNIRLSGLNSGFAGAAIADGSVVCCAVDFDNDKIWFRINGGNWNNSGSDNPATNTGGLSISGFPDLFPYAGADRAVHTVTANFGATAFAFTAPAGFGPWDEPPSSEPPSSEPPSSEPPSSEPPSSEPPSSEPPSSEPPSSEPPSSEPPSSEPPSSEPPSSEPPSSAPSSEPASEPAILPPPIQCVVICS